MNENKLAARLKEEPKENGAELFFMGQAGFIIKDKKGLLYAVDVYFSDCCEREFGFKRLMPKILQPEEVVFDYILTTHGHYDHFDIDAMPILMSNEKTQLYTTADGVEECKRLGLFDHITQIEKNSEYKIGNILLKTVFCDHGELAPHAVGFLLTVDEKKILLCGDTAYRPEKIAYLTDEDIDVMFVPINGAFGNLNEQEAVEYIKLLHPRTVVPCHYGNFKEHGGSVELFNRLFKERVVGTTNCNLQIGDTLIIKD